MESIPPMNQFLKWSLTMRGLPFLFETHGDLGIFFLEKTLQEDVPEDTTKFLQPLGVSQLRVGQGSMRFGCFLHRRWGMLQALVMVVSWWFNGGLMGFNGFFMGFNGIWWDM